jgi:hypothetical protein
LLQPSQRGGRHHQADAVPAAWRGVKQAKDMPHQVLIGRIGIHYRLLFRTDANVVDIIDLVTRESLMTTLKRLRSN